MPAFRPPGEPDGCSGGHLIHQTGVGQPEQLAARVARLLGRDAISLRRLGAGADHTAWEVDGELVVRTVRDAEAAIGDVGQPAAGREARLLELVGAVSPIPVPVVVAVDPQADLLVTTKLGGTSLLDEPCAAPLQLAEQLAALLAALRTVDAAALRGAVEPDDVAPATLRAEAAERVPQIWSALPEAHRQRVHRFVTEAPPPPATELVLGHNDLGAEHLLAGVDRCRLTGVIDWSDAALVDPAIDLGRILRDLGAPTARAVARRLGHDGDDVVARASFYARCALLEDVEYGLETGDRRYLDAALASLPRTFDRVASGA